MTDQPTETSATRMLPDSEIRHISGRLVYAMQWIETIRQNPTSVTAEQRNQGNMAVYKSAADVPVLLGEVGLLRGLLNEVSGYLIDIAKTGSPDERIIALTACGLLQIELNGKDGAPESHD